MDRPIGFYLPLVLMVCGTVLYHIAQKTMPGAVSPFVPLAAAFATALVLCAFGILLTAREPVRVAGILNRSSLALGAAVVMIETGCLIAYRVGWKINRASLVSNVAVAILLIPVGAALFHESVSKRMTAGAALCIGGLLLLVQ